jgi:predicted nucleotidyltransferase
MGDNLITAAQPLLPGPLIPWIDSGTEALVRDMIATAAARHPDLLAVILYGSVARHTERALTEPDASDVDLLLVFDTDDENVAIDQGYAIVHSLGLARNRHLDAPREVQVQIASRTLGEWDPTFVEHVARDGIVLWARGPLPAPLGALAGSAADRDQAGRPGEASSASGRRG